MKCVILLFYKSLLNSHFLLTYYTYELNNVRIWEHQLMLLFVCKELGGDVSERNKMRVLRKDDERG